MPLLPLRLIVREPAARVQHGEVVEHQHVALSEADFERVLFGQEVDRVEGLGLEFRHGGHGGVVRGKVRAGERAAGELEGWAVGGEAVEEGARVVLALPESAITSLG